MIKDLALKLAQDRQKKIYQQLYREHRDSHKALHWSSRESQEKRFEVLSRIGNLQGKSILDIGCGMGDFFTYLRAQGIRAEMTGYDIVEEFLHIARRRHPIARFKPVNLSRSSAYEVFDYVFSSGLYAFGNKHFFEAMVRKAFRSCRVAYGFNIYHSQHDTNFLQLTSKEIEKVLKSLYPSRIDVIEDYLEGDTTFFVYR